MIFFTTSPQIFFISIFLENYTTICYCDNQHSPEYFPPLLLLTKQRMSRISSSSTMALTTPINQPCVAKLCCIWTTGCIYLSDRSKENRNGRLSQMHKRQICSHLLLLKINLKQSGYVNQEMLSISSLFQPLDELCRR